MLELITKEAQSMNLYVNAYDLGLAGDTLALALLTWVESGLKTRREVTVWATYEPDARIIGRRWLDRSGVEYRTAEGMVGDVASPAVFLLSDRAKGSGHQYGGVVFMSTRRFVELMSSEAELDFDCSGCGRFYSALPFLEQGDDAYCTECAPQLDMFAAEVV